MFQEISSAPGVVPVPSISWSRIWWNALARPSVTTYLGFANDPRAGRSRAYSWIVRAALVAGLLLGLIQYGGDIGAICLGPIFAALISVLVFAIGTTMSHLLARALGGTGTYDKLAYATAAYTAPSLLVGTLVGIVSFGWFLNVALTAYQLALLVVAVKAVHGLSWGRAAIPSALWLGLGAALFVMAVVILTAVQM